MDHPVNTPIFNEVDSTPIPPELKENEEYHLKLCLCPLCKHGMEVFGPKRPVSWILICRVIIYSLMEMRKGVVYFSLKDDMHGFVADHWHIFGQLDQFKTNPNRWKKAFLDGLSHSPFFQSGTLTLKKPNFWKLRRTECPWIKQKKNAGVINKEIDEEINKREREQIERDSRKIDIQPQFGFINSKENSPMPDFRQMHSIDQTKEFIKNTIDHCKVQLDKCSSVCANLSHNPNLNENMKKICDQFNWVHTALNTIAANIETTL